MGHWLNLTTKYFVLCFQNEVQISIVNVHTFEVARRLALDIKATVSKTTITMTAKQQSQRGLKDTGRRKSDRLDPQTVTTIPKL